MKYLTRTCKNLKYLEISRVGVIGDSLTSALPLASSLRTFTVSDGCDISVPTVLKSLKACSGTLEEGHFSGIAPSRGLVPMEWPNLGSLKVLTLQVQKSETATLNIVSMFLNV